MTSATTILDGASIEPGLVGGKGFALNQLIEMGASVPPTGSITTDGYRWFVRDSGLQRLIDDLRGEGTPDQADLDKAAPGGLFQSCCVCAAKSDLMKMSKTVRIRSATECYALKCRGMARDR